MADKTAVFRDNPIIIALIAALRMLGAVTRTNAEALLQLTVVEANLSDRERDAVLDAFPQTCPGLHVAPECGEKCQGRLITGKKATGDVGVDNQMHTLLIAYRLLGFDSSWLEYPLHVEAFGVSCNDTTCPCDRYIASAGGFTTVRQLIRTIALHRERFIRPAPAMDIDLADLGPERNA